MAELRLPPPRGLQTDPIPALTALLVQMVARGDTAAAALQARVRDAGAHAGPEVWIALYTDAIDLAQATATQGDERVAAAVARKAALSAAGGPGAQDPVTRAAAALDAAVRGYSREARPEWTQRLTGQRARHEEALRPALAELVIEVEVGDGEHRYTPEAAWWGRFAAYIEQDVIARWSRESSAGVAKRTQAWLDRTLRANPPPAGAAPPVVDRHPIALDLAPMDRPTERAAIPGFGEVLGRALRSQVAVAGMAAGMLSAVGGLVFPTGRATLLALALPIVGVTAWSSARRERRRALARAERRSEEAVRARVTRAAAERLDDARARLERHVARQLRDLQRHLDDWLLDTLRPALNAHQRRLADDAVQRTVEQATLQTEITRWSGEAQRLRTQTLPQLHQRVAALRAQAGPG